TGATLPICGPYHQRRQVSMRPLTVRTLRDWRPLSASRLPVVGCCGGGKSGFRRVDPPLHCLFVNSLPHGSDDIADLFLAARNPCPVGRFVNSFHHLFKTPRDLSLHRFGKLSGRHLGRLTHSALLAWDWRIENTTPPVYPNPLDRASQNCHALHSPVPQSTSWRQMKLAYGAAISRTWVKSRG